jgi:hypothetical protein
MSEGWHAVNDLLDVLFEDELLVLLNSNGPDFGIVSVLLAEELWLFVFVVMEDCEVQVNQDVREEVVERVGRDQADCLWNPNLVFNHRCFAFYLLSARNDFFEEAR